MEEVYSELNPVSNGRMVVNYELGRIWKKIAPLKCE
jgi:hypothetical protein